MLLLLPVLLVPLLLLLLNDLSSPYFGQHQELEHGRAFPSKKPQHVVVVVANCSRKMNMLKKILFLLHMESFAHLPKLCCALYFFTLQSSLLQLVVSHPRPLSKTHARRHAHNRKTIRETTHCHTHTQTHNENTHTQAQALLNLMIYCCCWNQLHASWYWNQQLCLVVVVVVDWITWYQQLCVRIPFK